MSEPQFRDPTTPARIAVSLLGAQALVFVWLMASITFRTWIYELDGLWELEKKLMLSIQVAYWITAIPFLAWFHRAHKNLAALGASTTTHTSMYAIGCWFMPILSLWHPCQVAMEIWRGSAGAPSDEPDAPPRDGGIALVVSWWVVYIGSGIAGAVSGVVTTSGDYETVNAVAVGANAFSLVAAVLAILVVLRITRRQIETMAGPKPLAF